MRATMFVLFILLSTTAMAQTDFAEPDPRGHAPRIETTENDIAFPWENSVYLAAGYGGTIGMRGEIGYNFGDIVFAGFSAGFGDKWSNKPQNGTYGIVAALHLWNDHERKLAPYLLLNHGSSFKLLSEVDIYTLAALGCKYPFSSLFTLRPEVFMLFSSRHVSGGGLFSQSPDIREKEQRIGISLTLEMELKQL